MTPQRSSTCQKLRVCSSCKKGTYCSKVCQRRHWSKHREQCKPETQSAKHSRHIEKKDKKTQLVDLVGKHCVVDCYIQGCKTQALWDTGSQVSIVNEKWKKTHLPSERLRDVSELIDGPNDLKIAAANGQYMPYKGWIEVTFKLAADGAVTEETVVPILVMKGWQACQPIIGYNVIEQIVTTAVNHPDAMSREQLHMILKATFPSLEKTNVPVFIDVVSAEQSCEYIVKTAKERVNIPKHSSVQVECKVKTQPLKRMSHSSLSQRWTLSGLKGLTFVTPL